MAYTISVQHRELAATLTAVHVSATIRRPRAAALVRAVPSIEHLRAAPSRGWTGAGAATGLAAATGSVLSGLCGSVVMGFALAYGKVTMPWSQAFASGLLGGAAIGLLLGALAGLLLGEPVTFGYRTDRRAR
jgi:hypothetical protein